MNQNCLLPSIIVVSLVYYAYTFIRRKMDPKYGLKKRPLNPFKFILGFLAIILGSLFIRLFLSLINPSEVLKINYLFMTLDLVLFFIYLEALEYFLRNGKAQWFLKNQLQ